MNDTGKLRLTGQFEDRVVLAKKLDLLIETARQFLKSRNWQGGADALYDAENLADSNGMYDDARRCREALQSLGKNKIPQWLELGDQPIRQ